MGVGNMVTQGIRKGYEQGSQLAPPFSESVKCVQMPPTVCSMPIITSEQKEQSRGGRLGGLAFQGCKGWLQEQGLGFKEWRWIKACHLQGICQRAGGEVDLAVSVGPQTLGFAVAQGVK